MTCCSEQAGPTVKAVHEDCTRCHRAAGGQATLWASRGGGGNRFSQGAAPCTTRPRPGEDLNTSVALCPRCRRETLPQLAKPSWHREKHRATKAEREPDPDPKAEAIRRRKESRALRKQLRTEGMIATVKTFLLRQTEKAAQRAPQLLNENCEDCLKLQHDAA